jgi:hypothetical protein
VRVPKYKLSNIFYFVQSLKGNANGRAVFEVINDFSNERKIKWQWCMCTDGGAAMTGRLSSLVSWAAKQTIQLFLVTVSSIGKPWRQRN